MSSENQPQVPEEQIPLKTTEESAAAAEPETAPPEEPKPKKNWFTWGKKKNAEPVVDVEAANTDADAENAAEKPKKCYFWQRRACQKSENDQEKENIAIGIDLVHRDEKNLNNHVQLAFDDIFGEADSQHSWDFVWRLNNRVFNATRVFIYRLLGLFALPFTILFAILFALFSVLNVYILYPLVKLFSIPANGLANIWRWLVHSLIAPISTSVGLLASNIVITRNEPPASTLPV